MSDEVLRVVTDALTAAEVEQVVPAGAVRVDGTVEPLVSWLRVWDWSPVLPEMLLDGFGPLLAAVCRLRQAGPLAAAAALAGAPDAGATGCATVLQRLVATDPGAWTADIPAMLAALILPELGAFYLAAAAAAVRRPEAFPAGPAEPVLAALALSRALPAPADPHVPDAGEYAGRAWSGLLTFVWRTGGGLGGDLLAVLDRLHAFAELLTRPAAAPPIAATPAAALPPAGRAAGQVRELPAGLLESHPAVRALDCLLDYAAGRARGDVLDLAAAVLAARGGDEAVAGAGAFRVVHALLTGHDDLLGEPVSAWRELAAGPGGAEAASGFLGYLALVTSMRPVDRTAVDTERVWWTAALEAGLPPGALAGAGRFAAALPDEVWLPLARRSAAHTPAQEDAGRVAERAAAHPRARDALLLAAHLLTRPASEGAYDGDVRRHARTLLRAAEVLPAPERPAETAQLRRALVEAGEVDLAGAPSAAG
ncbi:hypothetical protein ACF09H_32175 [Streptomyces sp. NPDC014983]|uniref:hypothetical protein n=1 Tax=Streptomyces sp. NPDC014983 TaxID=3364933 RepID=UPI0036FF321B